MMKTDCNGSDRPDRRNFLRSVTVGIVGPLVIGGWGALGTTSSLRADDVVIPVGKITINLSEYPLLKADNGSDYVEVPGIPDIIVTRLPGPVYYAVTSECTHQACTVDTFDPQSGQLRCPCHFSTYRPDGTIVGGPAPKPLLRFPVEAASDNQLVIDVSKLGFLISKVSIHRDKNSIARLAITFDTSSGMRYGLAWKGSLNDTDWKEIQFSETLDGPFSETLVWGTGDPVTVFTEAVGNGGYFVLNRFRLLSG
jgi:cytochrome b6-f complex iron-sulfur subunit